MLTYSTKTPEWMTEEGLKTLQSGYLLEGETPVDMFNRVAMRSAEHTNIALAPYFMEALMRNWLCLASPVASNLGTTRGLPISCFGLQLEDSVDGIFSGVHELAMMSKNGGGVGIGLSAVRGRGAPIRGNGVSEGIVPWAKVFDSATIAVNQGQTRRGATSVNLSADHPDIMEFLQIRRSSGDVNRQSPNLHQCVVVSDRFMQRVVDGDAKAREVWLAILRARLETGEPYIMYEDNVNRASPKGYGPVSMTNICSEITLHTDPEHSFVCCLSSLNLARYDEWKDFRFSNGMTLPELATWFLDGVLSEFIERAESEPKLAHAVASAVKGRAIGLGVLGWHTYLQSHDMVFDSSIETMGLNSRVFRFIQEESDKASRDMGEKLGIPQWAEGRRNTHTTALAPTATNSIISGGVSPSIEPWAANAFVQKTAKGVFVKRNPVLEELLTKYGYNGRETWQSIVANEGSVQHLDFLTEHEKKVFLTAREIPQYHLIGQAAARQPYIDQSQSLNIFVPADVDAKWFHQLHVDAWTLGVKTLYYCRSGSVLKGDVASRFYDGCDACEG